jgi:hypothetical protein
MVPLSGALHLTTMGLLYHPHQSQLLIGRDPLHTTMVEAKGPQMELAGNYLLPAREVACFMVTISKLAFSNLLRK